MRSRQEILTSVFYELWTHELSDLRIGANNRNLNEPS